MVDLISKTQQRTSPYSGSNKNKCACNINVQSELFQEHFLTFLFEMIIVISVSLESLAVIMYLS